MNSVIARGQVRKTDIPGNEGSRVYSGTGKRALMIVENRNFPQRWIPSIPRTTELHPKPGRLFSPVGEAGCNAQGMFDCGHLVRIPVNHRNPSQVYGNISRERLNVVYKTLRFCLSDELPPESNVIPSCDWPRGSLLKTTTIYDDSHPRTGVVISNSHIKFSHSIVVIVYILELPEDETISPDLPLIYLKPDGKKKLTYLVLPRSVRSFDMQLRVLNTERMIDSKGNSLVLDKQQTDLIVNCVINFLMEQT